MDYTIIEIDGSALKSARGDQTQAEVAAAVGVTPSQISQYELGYSMPGANVLIRLMMLLNIRPIELVGKSFFEKKREEA